MKDKKNKYLEDLIEEFIDLTEEQTEHPLLVDKAKTKYQQFLDEQPGTVISAADAQEAFKAFSQLKKLDERKAELEAELGEVESQLKEFLQFFHGHKISYEKKDDNKAKITYLFWMEDGVLKYDK